MLFRSAPGAGVADAVVQAVLRGYRLKVQPDYDAVPDVEQAVRALVPHLLDRLRASIGECAGHPVGSLGDALDLYRRLPGAAAIEADNLRLMERDAIRLLVRQAPQELSIRHLLYSALPILLERAPIDQAQPGSGADWDLSAWFDVPPELDGAPAWERARTSLVAGWFEIIH